MAGVFYRLESLTKRALLAFILFTAVFPVLADDSTSAYAAWVKPWAARPITSAALGDAGLKCITTTVCGEVPLSVAKNMTSLERLDLAYRIRASATEVTTNGASHCYFVSNSDVKPGSLNRLTADDLKRLDQWIARLPEDNAQLPPPGRRVVVQVLEKGRWRVRVYDGASAPPEVKAILGLLANPFDKIL